MVSNGGFSRVAPSSQVGFKFERWPDLIFLQRFLEAPLL
jgi:L-amino acid N-acyltransferase YncA